MFFGSLALVRGAETLGLIGFVCVAREAYRGRGKNILRRENDIKS